jgi:hypothetical protein
MTKSLHIENDEALTRIFGGWPSFHDAEVLSVHLDRGDKDGASLEARIHVFKMTSEVDERGYYVLTDHTLVTLFFANIILRELRGFNHQNALFGIGIEEVDPATNDGRRLAVAFEVSYGVETHFLCDRVIVRSVGPFGQAG